MIKVFTNLCNALTEARVRFDTGDRPYELNSQQVIRIHDEQDDHPAISLYFNIDKDGNEKFVCQE